MRILSTDQGQFKKLESYLGEKVRLPAVEEKSLLRAKIKKLRVELFNKRSDLSEWGPGQVELFLRSLHVWEEAQGAHPPEFLVTSFLPLPGEFHCHTHAKPWWLFPHVAGPTKLKWFSWGNGIDELIPNKFGIREAPLEKTFELDKSKKVYCFVPALAVDKMGIRLGYGGGYYDRLLAENLNIISVVCTTEDFIFESLPSEAHDARINYIVTPTQVWKVS